MGISWKKVEDKNCIGRKYIDLSMFKYGIHIPIDYREQFLNNIHENKVELGKSQNIKFIFNDYIGECEIRNINSKARSETIQIRYDSNKELREYLQNKFIYTYKLLNEKDQNDTDEYIDIFTGEDKNTFNIKLHIHEADKCFNEEVEKFINVIKTTSMSKSYKIPLLWAFYNKGNIKLKINEDDIYESFKDFYSKEENEIDLQGQKSTQDYKTWGKKEYVSLVKNGPIKYLSEGTPEYFYKESDLFCLSDKLEPYINNKEFINEFKQAIELLEAKYYKRELKRAENLMVEEVSESYMERKEVIIHIQSYIQNKGYTYTYNQLSNLYLSLKTKPFVILAGISGTGKSKIVRLLAESLGATSENNQFNMISVRPDWNDSTELIGYKNLEDQFIEGYLIKIIQKANENKNKPYFVCLDEMNLARVEYYLSDYLSIIESRKKVGQDIITDNLIENEIILKNTKLNIPDNLYLIGTVNMDDTTFQFSRKVLDRANTIEFSDVDLENLFGEITYEDIEPLDVSNEFLKTTYLKTLHIEEDHREYAKIINKKIVQINEILKKSQKQFAYRVRDEILFYMIENKKSDLLEEDVAFDYQIMQKILPAITGSESSVEQVLIDLFNFICDKPVISGADIEEAENYLQKENVGYKNSAEKIIYMLKGYSNDGYVSYWY